MQNVSKENESFYSLFIPLTTKKAIIFLVIIGIIVYSNSLFNGFVWDDVTYILLSTDIHTFNIIHLFQQNAFNNGGYYRPIPAVYFSLLYNLFGQQVFYYHFFQLALHITDTCLVLIFFKKFFKVSLSFFLALLFLVHPIQVESVVYIGASQSELLFFFGMSALLISMQKSLSKANLIILSILLLLSLLTKETSFLFLLIIILYQLFFNRRALLRFTPYLGCVIACYFYIRLILVNVPFQSNESAPIGNLTLLWRILNIPDIFFYYVKTFFYPAVLGIDQRWIVTTIAMTNFYVPLVLDIIFFLFLCFLGYISYRKAKQTFHLFVFFFLWFFLGMGILMQIIPLDMTVSERWFYFPIVGLLGMIGLGLSSVRLVRRNDRIGGIIFLSILVILLSIRTMVRNTDWSDQVTLFSHDLHTDDNYDIESMLGTQLALDGQYKEGLPYLIKADITYPQDTYLYDIGHIYEQMGDYQKAKEYYLLAIKPQNITKGHTVILSNSYEGLGRMLLLLSPSVTTQYYMQKAVTLAPDDGALWGYLAISDYKLHQKNNALFAAKKANNFLHTPSAAKLYSIIQNNQSLNLHY